MRLILLIVLSISLVLFTNCSQTKDLIECKNYNFFFDLDVELFSGKWYPLVVSSNAPKRKKLDCVRVNIKKVSHDQLFAEARDTRSRANAASASLFLTKSKNTYKLSIAGLKGLVTVLDTDYKSYAVLLACTDFLLVGKSYYVAILGRQDKLPQSLIKRLESFIEAKVGIKKLKEVKQGDSCYTTTDN